MNNLAVAKPMPVVPPVIRTNLIFDVFIFILSVYLFLFILFV